jgi:hypothetical protein
MKATKYEVKITVDVLSMDSVPAMLYDTANRIKEEYVEGDLSADDGDKVRWETKSSQVEF